MSTANKLTYLNVTKQKLKQAINNLGGSIDEHTTFRQYANQLDGVYDVLPKTSFQEGTEVTIENGLKGKIDFDTQDGKKIVGYGDTEQDGEPTPTNEVPIQCVTGNQSIVESGKNLFEPVLSIDGTDIIRAGVSSISVSNGEYTLVASATDMYFGQVLASGSSYNNTRGIKIYKNGNEKISYKISNIEINRMFITAYDSNGISLGYTEKSGSSLGTYTFPTNCEFVTFRIGKGNAVSGTIYKFNVMVAYGDTIPDYEPYHTPITYPISLGSNKFYSIGDYADELLYDVENDKVYKYENIEKTTLTSSMCTSVTASASYGTLCYLNFVGKVANSSVCALSNKFVGVSYDDRTSMPTGYRIFTSDGSGAVTIRFPNTSDIDTLQEVKDFVDNNEIIACYVLSTPTLTEITDTTLKQQVKNWYYSQSFSGTTILESNGDLPMIIKVRGLKGE